MNKNIILSDKERNHLINDLLSSTDSCRDHNFDEDELTLNNLDEKKASNFDMEKREFFMIKSILKKLRGTLLTGRTK